MENMEKPLKIPAHGLKLATLYYQPEVAGPYPLVILLHGFTGWKEEDHLTALGTALAAAGIAAISFDAPGSGESEGTWAEHYRFSTYWDAALTVREYAIKHLNADPARVGIWGHSMGGLLALELASAEPDKFVALCASEPSSGRPYDNLDEWKRTDSRHFSNSQFPDINLPWAFYEDRLKYFPKRLPSAQNLKVPVLYFSGTKDKLSPAELVRELYDATPGNKQYEEYAMGHGYKKYPDTLAKVTSVTVEFFAAHLLPR
jgi:pimeloyl-ACP methyl ester carboxylesterase